MLDVSVIIPLFNKAQTLPDTLRSLARQSAPPAEILVVNDGSSDSSLDIARECARLFDATPTSYSIITGDHRGVSVCLNEGLRAAKSAYVTRVDADDLVSPVWLETMLSCVSSQRPVPVRCALKRVPASTTLDDIESEARLLDRESLLQRSRVVSSGVLFESLFTTLDPSLMTTCGMLYPRAYLERNHLSFDEDLSHTEDLLFNARLFALGEPVCCLDEAQYYYRQFPASLSRALDDLFAPADAVGKRLLALSARPATARIARVNEGAMLSYISTYFALAVLQEELRTSSTPVFGERIQRALESTEYHSFTEKALERHRASRLARTLHALATKKQYAQLRLVARTVNVARKLRRRFNGWL